MRVLVAGGDRVDAGKTTFTAGLLARTGAVGFKPRAGNDYWFDHDDFRTAVEEGRLYGNDAARLASASAADVPPEAINPVHRLWRPSPGEGRGLVGAAHREFVLDRVGDAYVVNDRADVPDSAREHLPLAGATRVDSLAELNDATADRHLPAFEALAERIRDRRYAVVESYGDVAVPIRNVSFDAAAVVEPARVRVYDGARFLKAHRAAGGGSAEGRLERRVPDVESYLDPVAALSLPALPSAERSEPERVAEAYEVAYDAVLAAAVE